jgi:hypothetical protein
MVIFILPLSYLEQDIVTGNEDIVFRDIGE